jgi:transcriptional regulator with XRE-family HTH domain
MKEMTLDELRSSRQITQAQLSQALGITQAAISKLEFRHDSYLSSVRKYIEAIGGRMEIHAVFPGGAVKLRGLDGDEKLTLLRSMTRTSVRISPQLVGNTVPCRNHFTIVGIDDDDRTVELRKDSGHHVYIPIRRIVEVLSTPSTQKSATLVINGRVEWFSERDGGAWHFVE